MHFTINKVSALHCSDRLFENLCTLFFLTLFFSSGSYALLLTKSIEEECHGWLPLNPVAPKCTKMNSRCVEYPNCMKSQKVLPLTVFPVKL